MTGRPVFFAIRGGLDQETPSLVMKPGALIGGLNHEMTALGCQRTEGYERFDGRSAPSEATFFSLTFTAGAQAFADGQIINGYTSGAQSRVIGEATLTSGSFAGGDAAGSLFIHLIEGEFEAGETLRDDLTPLALLASEPIEEDRRASDEAEIAYRSAVTYLRSLIEPVPGEGPVRGVLYFEGKISAWRNNIGSTAGEVHHSSAGGWTQPDLGSFLRFSDGGAEIFVGDVITGAVSGATATVRAIEVDGGTGFEFGDATGTLILDNIVGTFEDDEGLNVGDQGFVAKVDGLIAEVIFPPDGRYEFDTFNFKATTGFERAFGANGVGQAFQYDGDDVVIPILTGMEEIAPGLHPFLVREHKNHLFLAYPHGSLQHSVLGEPLTFNARIGAAELGMGYEITNLIPSASAMLLVTTADTLAMLSGNDSSDWLLEPLAEKSGAKAWTAQRIGEIVYLDNRGLRSVASTQFFANFKVGTYTSMISRELKNKRLAGAVPTASAVIKTKDQYLLFFSDGSGISIFFGSKKPEPLLFTYPFVVSCIHVVEVDGVERIFVGAEDGYIYELNKGTSFDGATIESYIQLPFMHQGDPRTLKRYHNLELEMRGDRGTRIAILAQYDYGNDEQPNPFSGDVDLASGGALWDLANWDDFIWSAPLVDQAQTYLDGTGFNIGVILASNQDDVSSYIFEGMTLVFSPRGSKR